MKIKIDMYYEVLTDRIHYFKEDEEWQLCAKLVTGTSALRKNVKSREITNVIWLADRDSWGAERMNRK